METLKPTPLREYRCPDCRKLLVRAVLPDGTGAKAEGYCKNCRKHVLFEAEAA